MKPNFEQMSVSELRAYVLAHREDEEAIRALFHHPSLEWVSMPPLYTEDGQPIEQNIILAEEALRQRIEKERLFNLFIYNCSRLLLDKVEV